MADTRLMLHFNGTDAATSTVDATGRHWDIVFAGTAQIDTAAKKWGLSSLLVDGNSDYLTLGNSEDWYVCSDADEDWTIDLWVKHDDHVGTEVYLSHWEDASNYWSLEHLHGSGVRFVAVSGGGTIITTGYGGEITDTNWHHVALCKVGNEYGIYVDGSQVAYTQDSSVDTFAGSLFIACQGTPSSYFDGHLDDIRIDKTNHFSAAPNVGESDTITPPAAEYEYYELLPEFPTLTRSPQARSWSEQQDPRAVIHSGYSSGMPMVDSPFTFDPKHFSHTIDGLTDADKATFDTFYAANKARTFLWLNVVDSLKYQVQFTRPPKITMLSPAVWRVELELLQVNSETVS